MAVSRSRSNEQGSVYVLDRLVFLIHHTYRRRLPVTAVNVSTAGPFGFYLSKQKSYRLRKKTTDFIAYLFIPYPPPSG